MAEIRNRFSGEVMHKDDTLSVGDLVAKVIANRLPGTPADLRYADLRYADLRYADLRYADLRYADLRYADLRYADLRYADLRYADLPSPTMVLLANWRKLSDQLTADLMLFDANNHPNAIAFDVWSNGGPCPYANVKVQRAANFIENRELWGTGIEVKPYDLMDRVLEEQTKNWKQGDNR